MQEQHSGRHRIVVVGGGFGGLETVRALRRAPADVLLIDRRNYHLFQPLLYQVATGALSPANIAAPLRHLVSRQKNASVMLAEVKAIDARNNQLHLDEGTVSFDTLVLAAGATHSYFGHDEWAEWAPGLKTIEDATEIRSRILKSFEAAEREDDANSRRRLLTFVIVGGGPTGVELAGALGEIARHSLRDDFRTIDPAEARILLVEADKRVLSTFPVELSEKAEKSLKKLGVQVCSESRVTSVTADGVTVSSKAGDEVIATSTVLWAAGVTASPLARSLADSSGAQIDRAGRVIVSTDCSVPQAPQVFVIGDMAHYQKQDGGMLPGVAPVAIQQGRFVGKLLTKRLQHQPEPEFHYRDHGNLATIGRSAAVADFGKFRISGFIAWMLWLVVHLFNIATFRNRLLVMIQWGWSYLSYDRSARLITGPNASPVKRPDGPLVEPLDPTSPHPEHAK